MATTCTRPVPPDLATLLREEPAALFLDFDGTLVELAPSPHAITPRPNLSQLLIALSDQLCGRLALVTGRSIQDLRSFLGPIPLAIAGSHGASIMLASGTPLGQEPRGIGADASAALRNFAAQEGLYFEAKAYGGALHFRTAPEKEEAANAFADALAASLGLMVKRGKCVVELVERGADKGAAVDALMKVGPFSGAAPWFVGDDVTDEDGFAACKRLGGRGVLVGDRQSKADHALADVEAVHRWLGFE